MEGKLETWDEQEYLIRCLPRWCGVCPALQVGTDYAIQVREERCVVWVVSRKGRSFGRPAPVDACIVVSLLACFNATLLPSSLPSTLVSCLPRLSLCTLTLLPLLGKLQQHNRLRAE